VRGSAYRHALGLDPSPPVLDPCGRQSAQRPSRFRCETRPSPRFPPRRAHLHRHAQALCHRAGVPEILAEPLARVRGRLGDLPMARCCCLQEPQARVPGHHNDRLVRCR
jgi:hypothetical protein